MCWFESSRECRILGSRLEGKKPACNHTGVSVFAAAYAYLGERVAVPHVAFERMGGQLHACIQAQSPPPTSSHGDDLMRFFNSVRVSLSKSIFTSTNA